MLTQYIKHLIVHTPLEAAAQQLQHGLQGLRRWSHPELISIHEEPRWVDHACRLVLRPDSNTIDIGAHLGTQLGRFVDLAPLGHHMAFEPVPHKARWLRRKFPSVEVHELALHETSSVQRFFVNETAPGYSGLRRHQRTHDNVREITVTQHRLDDVIDHTRPVDLVKLDVEGAELFVLRGATRLLSRHQPTLLFEPTLSALAAWELTPSTLFGLLEQHGYRVYLPRVFVNGGSPLSSGEFAASHEYPFRAFNFVAVGKDRPLGRRHAPPTDVLAPSPAAAVLRPSLE